jgi:hypothetical protein
VTPFPRDAFAALVASIIGCPPAYVTWFGQPEPSYMKPVASLTWASVRLKTNSRTAVGSDDLRVSDDGDGSFTVNMVGRRVINISVDCFVWASADAFDADEFLELLTTRLFRPDSLDKLNGMALVYETCGPILTLPTTINARYITAAHVDLTVALANQDASTETYPGGNQYVGEVQSTGTIKNEGGVGSPVIVDVAGR